MGTWAHIPGLVMDEANIHSYMAAVLILAGTLLWHGQTRSDFLIQTQANEEQAVPQGNEPPGPDDPGQPQAAPEKNNGVITPPPTGDEVIHTTVPNPDAGHDEEVIPPPGTPENAPNLDRAQFYKPAYGDFMLPLWTTYACGV